VAAPRKIAIFAKEAPAAQALARRIARSLRRGRVDVLVDESTARAIGEPRGFPRSRMPADRPLTVAVGGDGTLLTAARATRNGAEILGINVGTLGFLTGASRREWEEAVEDLLGGRLLRDERRFLEVDYPADHRRRRRFVLNDAVLNRGALSRIAHYTLRLEGIRFSSLRGDGLILSTPTGSTAYNLSAGGPLLHPEVHAYLVTPICPHALTHRPLVLPGDRTLEVVAESGSPEGIFLTLDGQEGVQLSSGSVVRARVSRRKLTLLRRPRSDYFGALSEKLNWGA
jgi:NAD+ kinase